MDAAAENPVIRRQILEILVSAGGHVRQPGDDPSTYVGEAVIQRALMLRGFALPIERLRQELYWLYERGKTREREAGYAKFHRTTIAGEVYFTWRITDLGRDVIDRLRPDPGVAGA